MTAGGNRSGCNRFIEDNDLLFVTIVTFCRLGMTREGPDQKISASCAGFFLQYATRIGTRDASRLEIWFKSEIRVNENSKDDGKTEQDYEQNLHSNMPDFYSPSVPSNMQSPENVDDKKYENAKNRSNDRCELIRAHKLISSSRSSKRLQCRRG